MSRNVIEIRGVTMRYGGRTVLDDLDLDIARGEVVALLGPNGAGKTTTVEILEGFRSPQAGTVSVLGQNPLIADEEWRSRVGVVLQSWRDHSRWRVREVLALFASFYAPSPARRPFDVDQLLDDVGLAEHARARLRTLSGGQRRRLDVALGVVGRPDVLFLDEPTAGFDPVARRDFHELVHRLADLDDMTILITTHDLAEAEKLADRILILDGGRIVADGSPERLAREAAAATEVRWVQDGQRHVHATADATEFVRELLAGGGERIGELEIVRASLEDAYLEMVRRHEAAPPAPADREDALR